MEIGEERMGPKQCKPPTLTPAYVALYPHLCEVARQHGYALAIHGSVARDMDLVAVPWTDEASDSWTLRDAIVARLRIANPHDRNVIGATEQSCKPHGRIAWAITLGNGAVLDLSVATFIHAKPATPPAAPIAAQHEFCQHVESAGRNVIGAKVCGKPMPCWMHGKAIAAQHEAREGCDEADALAVALFHPDNDAACDKALRGIDLVCHHGPGCVHPEIAGPHRARAMSRAVLRNRVAVAVRKAVRAAEERVRAECEAEKSKAVADQCALCDGHVDEMRAERDSWRRTCEKLTGERDSATAELARALLALAEAARAACEAVDRCTLYGPADQAREKLAALRALVATLDPPTPETSP